GRPAVERQVAVRARFECVGAVADAAIGRAGAPTDSGNEVAPTDLVFDAVDARPLQRHAGRAPILPERVEEALVRAGAIGADLGGRGSDAGAERAGRGEG